MNRLELCRAYYRETGESFSAPSTTVGAGGYDALIVGHIDQAWLEIQNLHGCWDWMWSRFETALNTSDTEYSLSARASRAVRGSLTVEVDGEPDQRWPLAFKPWAEFRAINRLQTSPAGRPAYWSATPAGKLIVDRVPDQVYRVRGDIYADPSNLTANTSTPGMPAEHHWIIVYLALKHYGRYEAAAEQYNGGAEGYRRALLDLERTQLPQVQLGACPLA